MDKIEKFSQRMGKRWRKQNTPQSIQAVAETPSSAPSTLNTVKNMITASSTISNSNVGITSDRNLALQIAIEQHLATLPDPEKEAFRQGAQQMTDDSILRQVKSYDMDHRNRSSFQPHAESLSRFLGLLNRFMDSIAIGIQANPDISSIIVGAARVLITVAVGFVGFFDVFSSMIGRISNYLGPFTVYAQSATKSKLIEDCLVKTYIDTLTMFRYARRVFVDDSGTLRKSSSWRVFWRIHWIPFEEEFGQIEAEMKHHLDVLGHASQATNLNQSFQASREDRERRKREKNSEREEFLRWLSSYSFEEVHAKVYAKRHPETGNWLLQRPEFETWFTKPESAFLWCHGNPGAGKTVLASNVIEYVTSQRALDEKVGIAFVYYDYKDPGMPDESVIITELMKQLCRKKGDIIPGFSKVKHDALPASQLGNFDSFSMVATQFDEVFLIIDAFDECPKTCRPAVFNFLQTVTAQISRAKVFVTSRRERDIEEAFRSLDTPQIMIEARNVEKDISRFVQDEVQRLRTVQGAQKLYIKSDELELKIIQTLTTKAEGTFLWVNLQLKNLCEVSQSQRDTEVEKTLLMLPVGLEATYSRSLEKICQQRDDMKALAFRTLRWVMYAERPLTPDELRHALAAEEMSDPKTNPELDQLVVIISACAHLLEVASVNSWIQVVRPIHYSVQEFITTTDNMLVQGQLLNTLDEAPQIQAKMNETCITYLESRLTDQEPCENWYYLDERLKNHSFLWYAAQFFDVHLHRCSSQKEAINCTMDMLRQSDIFLRSLVQIKRVSQQSGLAQSPDTSTDFDLCAQKVDAPLVIFSTKLYDIREFDTYWENTKLRASLLHSACSAGLRQAVCHLLQTGLQVDVEDTNGVAPLYYAARAGHADVVQLLLRHGANVHAQRGYYGNALQAASAGGYETVVQLLLDKGADVNVQGGYNGNALYVASAEGHETVVQLLLDQGAEVNAQGGRYGNALQAALAGGHGTVVQLLLDKGADVNVQGGDYGNALYAASAGGHETVVQLLLDKGTYVNAQGGDYANALYAASSEGHETVVQLLLDKGADANAQGGRALQAASAQGHGTLVQLLLDKGADINAQGGYYGNVLQAASAEGHRTVVQLLLDKGADVNAQGGHYGNALQAASAGGHETVVQLLLDKGANVDAQGGDYGNALQAASAEGHRTVVQLLLDKDVDVNVQGGCYGNALYAASVGGRETVVQLLLDKGANVNAQSGYYGNALQAASAEGHETVVRLLLDKGADVNAQGGGYGNALQAASARGHATVVQLLLDKGAREESQ